MFNEDKTAVLVLPFEAWVSTLLAQKSHKANHEGIAGMPSPDEEKSLGDKRPETCQENG